MSATISIKFLEPSMKKIPMATNKMFIKTPRDHLSIWDTGILILFHIIA